MFPFQLVPEQFLQGRFQTEAVQRGGTQVKSHLPHVFKGPVQRGADIRDRLRRQGSLEFLQLHFGQHEGLAGVIVQAGGNAFLYHIRVRASTGPAHLPEVDAVRVRAL